MKIEIISRSSETLEEYDYNDKLQIKIDGNLVFEVRDGEPEDNNLSRNFNDCWNIEDLMLMAYEAGKRRENFEVIDIDE